MHGAFRSIRRGLDIIYDLAGWLAACCLVAILGVTAVQVVARWLGIPTRGSNEYAGYFMAAASFLAFAHTLNRGAHIRVGLLLGLLGRWRYWGELWATTISAAAAIYLAWYAVKLVYWSWRLKDVSQGQDATPLWIVQIPVAVGAIILAVCLIDNLVCLLVTGRDNIARDLTDQPHAEH